MGVRRTHGIERPAARRRAAAGWTKQVSGGVVASVPAEGDRVLAALHREVTGFDLGAGGVASGEDRPPRRRAELWAHRVGSFHKDDLHLSSRRSGERAKAAHELGRHLDAGEACRRRLR
jgi:hypothetical protein